MTNHPMTNPRSPTLARLLPPLLALTLLPAAAADPPPEAPILRIETGMHTAPITRIDADAAGRFLITGSLDKTARVWGLASGELLRVLRPPIGEGNEGKIYAVAMSPDGELVAAGGWTRIRNNDIYLFDRRTGRLLRRIAGLPNVVHHLAFSPDGSRLAASLGGANGLRVFRAADGEELHRDTEPGDRSYWADFDAAGRLITTSWDGRLRLYGRDHRRLTTAEAPGGKRPFAAAFSPDGQRIAVGYRDSTRVDVLSGDDLRLLYSADTEATNGYLSSVAWSADGTLLFAAGYYNVGGKRPIRRWGDAGQGAAHDLEGPLDTVMDLHPLAGRGLIFGSADPAWGVLDATGERATYRGPSQADPRNDRDSFRVDRRGERLRFAYQPYGKRPALFSLPDRRLLLDPAAGDRFEGHALNPPRTAAPGLEITGWQGTTEPRRGGKPLSLETHEISRSLAVAADGKSFLLGTEWLLRAFRRDGTSHWPKPVPVPGVAWSVNLTADGRLALAAFGDGTIRWYRARDGVELLAFFPHADGKRWVLWTPGGYYDASVDGEDLIGWHVNNGPDQAADFYPAHSFRDLYRRPEVIDLVLETLGEQQAPRRAGAAKPPATRPEAAPPPAAPPPLVLPPVVTVLDPADGAVVSTPVVKLRINVRSPTGAPVDAIRVAVDGRVVATRDAEWPGSGDPDARDFYQEREVPIPARDCTVEVTAEAAGRASTPARVRLKWRAPAPRPERRVWLLAVGVSKYRRPDYELGFAAQDARDLAGAWKALEGSVYASVETRVLTDQDAGRDDILDGLDWLTAAGADHDDDLVVLFLAGHGVNQAGEYYFLPHDADPARRGRTLLSQSQLHGILRALPGRVLLFLDTCRAGSFTAAGGKPVRQRVDPTGFANDMAYNAGVLVFSAAASRQLSQESPEWANGAFTEALLQALAGRADRDGDGLTSTELEGYLYDTVRGLTDDAQTPVAAKGSIPDLVVVPAKE